MQKSIFSQSVINAINKKLLPEITRAMLGSPALRKEINKTLQQANRRIQNIENAGLASPAVKAVIAERGKKDYTYFSIKGLKADNATDWEMMKYEYGRAMSFLNNPTSTATGARQYIRYQAKELHNIPFESANKIVDLATSPTIDEYGSVNIFKYGELLDKYKTEIMQVADKMKENAKDYAIDLENALLDAINKIHDSNTNSFLDRFF